MSMKERNLPPYIRPCPGCGRLLDPNDPFARCLGCRSKRVETFFNRALVRSVYYWDVAFPDLWR